MAAARTPAVSGDGCACATVAAQATMRRRIRMPDDRPDGRCRQVPRGEPAFRRGEVVYRLLFLAAGGRMQLLKRVWHNILATDVLGLAAQTAYFFFFSLFPLLLFTAPFLSLVGNKAATVGIIMQGLARSVPPDAYLLIQNVVNDVVFSKNAPGVLSLGAILTIWAGSNVFSALIDALNHAFAVNDSRPWWRRTLICFAFVIGAALVGLIATVVLLDGEQVVQIITGFFGLGETTRFIWTVLEF